MNITGSYIEQQNKKVKNFIANKLSYWRLDKTTSFDTIEGIPTLKSPFLFYLQGKKSQRYPKIKRNLIAYMLNLTGAKTKDNYYKTNKNLKPFLNEKEFH